MLVKAEICHESINQTIIQSISLSVKQTSLKNRGQSIGPTYDEAVDDETPWSINRRASPPRCSVRALDDEDATRIHEAPPAAARRMCHEHWNGDSATRSLDVHFNSSQNSRPP